MIHQGDKEIISIITAGRAVQRVIRGGRLLWEAIRSCFGKGYWRGEEPWRGTDAWKG